MGRAHTQGLHVPIISCIQCEQKRYGSILGQSIEKFSPPSPSLPAGWMQRAFSPQGTAGPQMEGAKCQGAWIPMGRKALIELQS